MNLTDNKLELEHYKQLGVDITILLENLKRTPTERILNHQEMLALVEEARKRLKHNGQIRKINPKL